LKLVLDLRLIGRAAFAYFAMLAVATMAGDELIYPNDVIFHSQ
jgi:hypothetical protein